MSRNGLRSDYLRPGFGGRLRSCRHTAGLSQRQLAFEGCTAAYISRLEDDERFPSLQIIAALARRLAVDPHWLATGESSSSALGTCIYAGRAFLTSFREAVDEDGRVTLARMEECVEKAETFERTLADVPAALEELRQTEELLVVKSQLDEALGVIAGVQAALVREAS